jgi:hypothetical protein
MSITCKKATEFIIKNEEGKLSLSQRVKLWRHLLICKVCKVFYNQNKLLNSALFNNKPDDNAALSDNDKNDIIAALKKVGEDSGNKK